MAKIIYGVSGQGFGHSTRSKEVLKYLISKGHQVLIFTYSQALFFLDEEFDVFEVPGLSLDYKDNKLVYWQTVYKNINQVAKQSRYWTKILEKFREFNPDLVITDFEPLTALLAKLQRIPLISIDNQHQLTNTRIKVPIVHRKDLLADKLIIKSMVWLADYYLITTFFDTPIIKKNTFLFPPIVRKEVRDLHPQKENYILVYQNSNFDHLIKVLKSIDYKFVVFGFNQEKEDGNITYKNYSSHDWLRYLANCQAIIGTAGLSLISEALYLRKPYLAVPIKKQVEQMINAHYVKEMGYGEVMVRFNKKDINGFLADLPNMEKRLNSVKQRDNSTLFRKLDQLISYLT